MDERPGEEFREFMHGRWPSMVRLAYGLTGDQGHAEDVVQAAFARATDHFAVRVVTPIVMLSAAIALVGLGLTGKWKLRDSPGPGPAAARDAGRLAPAADPVSP